MPRSDGDGVRAPAIIISSINVIPVLSSFGRQAPLQHTLDIKLDIDCVTVLIPQRWRKSLTSILCMHFLFICVFLWTKDLFFPFNYCLCLCSEDQRKCHLCHFFVVA